MKTTRRPPGPPARFVLGNALEYQRDSVGFLQRLAAEHGDVAAFRLGPQRFCLLSDAHDIDRVLVTESRGFAKPALLTSMGRLLFGQALTALDGETWARQRRLAMPAFRREHVSGAAQLAHREVGNLVDGWTSSAACPLDEALFDLTLRTYARVLFGEAAPPIGDVGEAMRAALHGFGVRVQRGLPTPDWLPVRHNRDMRRGMRVVRAYVRHAVAAAVSLGAPVVATALHRARTADGDGYTPEALCDELAVLWALGAHQTAVGLTWALHLLAIHPEHEERLRENAESLSTGAALPPFAAGFVDEALRLFPPFPAIVRQALERFTAGGYTIDTGAVVMISMWVTHRDPRHFDEPLVFRPERWTDDMRRQLPRAAYLPFGAGPRACIAAALARSVIGFGVLEVVRRFHLEEPPGLVVEPAPGVTLTMRGGLRLRLESRRERAA